MATRASFLFSQGRETAVMQARQIAAGSPARDFIAASLNENDTFPLGARAIVTILSKSELPRKGVDCARQGFPSPAPCF
jgi:hypothetical protein